MAKAHTDPSTTPPHKMEGEFRTGPVAGTAIVPGVTFGRKPLQFAEVDGMAVFEGDIILGPVDEVRAAAAGAASTHLATAAAVGISADAGPILMSVGITGPQFRWPNATIPFEIDAGLPNPQRVTDAIAHWQANTRIRFVPRTAAHADFVRFVSGGGCSSNVGRRGGAQTITLGPGCSTGNAIHEIGHTVGLWHEQSREDRDTFVRIEWANIDPALQHNFDQHIADGDDLGAYDYGSIMHYPTTAFSINGQPTITVLHPVPPGVVIGQRNGLSAGDIAGVNLLYPPPTPPTIKEVPKDPVLDPPGGTIKEVRKDPIFDPPTIKEIRKDPIFDPPGGTIKEVRKDPIFDPPTIKEVVRDPIGGGGTLVESIGGGIFGFGTAPPPAGGTPFVMAGQSNFGGANDPVANLVAQVQALGEALAATQQQLGQIAAAYDATIQALGGTGGGQ